MRRAVKLGNQRFQMFNWLQSGTNLLSIPLVAELFTNSDLSETRVWNIERVVESWEPGLIERGEDDA